MNWYDDISSWKHASHKVMAAQAQNIARMRQGLVLDSHDDRGNDRVIIGEAPAVIRLYDQPQRLHRAARYEDADRIVTIGPWTDKGRERVVQRDGRVFDYGIACQIGLNDAEQLQDRDEEGVDSPLGRKADAWVSDFINVFLDNIHLIHEGCATGLVDDAEYNIAWDPDIQYPSMLVIVQVTATLYT